MSRLDDIENKLQEVEEAMLSDKTKKRGLRFTKRLEKLGKKADKKINTVLVQYLTQKYQVKFMVCKVVSGNLVVIDNKAHELNPKHVWRYKKQLWYIVREIDRKPVSNVDYNKVKSRKDDTEADVPLIKAVLGAVQKRQATQLGGKSVWIIIILAIVGAVVFFTFFGGGG
jgi:hypothetical protein